MSDSELPNGLSVFGPDANCTLALCPVEWSVYGYRPGLATNSVFLAIFGVAMLFHIYLGIRWRQWFFMSFMVLGCIDEMAGYGGRIMLYNNPFDFNGFIMQIVLITTGPVFYTAAIYVTLSKTIYALGPELSRVNPKWFYWVFIPADLICLVLQGAGGALSSISQGSSQTGVDIAMAGLILQVVVLVFFIVALTDYVVRYFRHGGAAAVNSRTRLYFSFLYSAIFLIFGRCIYRCYELSDGYEDSELIRDEALFIGLEGVFIVLAVFALCIGHPGLLFSEKGKKSLGLDEEAVVERKHRHLDSTSD